MGKKTNRNAVEKRPTRRCEAGGSRVSGELDDCFVVCVAQ